MGPRLSLVLRGPNIPGIPDISIPLNNIPPASSCSCHHLPSPPSRAPTEISSAPVGGSNKSSANTTPTNTSVAADSMDSPPPPSYSSLMEQQSTPTNTPVPLPRTTFTTPVSQPLFESCQCLSTSPDTTIFSAVQNLMNCVPFQSRQEKLRRIWEPTYVIVYSEGAEATYDPTVSLSGKRRPSRTNIISPSPGSACAKSGGPACGLVDPCVENVLQLLRQLYVLSTDSPDDRTSDRKTFTIRREEFESKKISNKLTQQVSVSMKCIFVCLYYPN